MSRCAPQPRASRATHRAAITHTRPGEATITCRCHTLRTVVDVDDPQGTEFVLWQHFADTRATRLGVTDTRTGRHYTITDANQPETCLILTGGAS